MHTFIHPLLSVKKRYKSRLSALLEALSLKGLATFLLKSEFADTKRAGVGWVKPRALAPHRVFQRQKMSKKRPSRLLGQSPLERRGCGQVSLPTARE